MKRIPWILAVIIIAACAGEQQDIEGERARFERLAAEEVARHFDIPDRPATKLLMLGTFHFVDAGLDDYKPEHNIDMLAPERQDQLEELAELIRLFQPTKIAVEYPPDVQGRLDERYAQYRAGEYELASNEVFQLGFRIAGKLDHERVYCVDTDGRRFEDVPNRGEYARANGMADLLDDPFDPAFEALYAADDKRKLDWTLREHFLYMNAEPRIRAGHGAYLTGGFAVGDGTVFPGPDGFVSFWYNRNLRIFSNLLRLVENKDERILLIIGHGHLPILRHAALSAPQIELVEVADYLARD